MTKRQAGSVPLSLKDLSARIWQGIPGLERTQGGRIYVSWFTGGLMEPAPENTVVVCYSDDQGNTFSQPRVVGWPASDGTRCFDPALWLDPKGRLWYIFNRGNMHTAKHEVWARICAAPDATEPVFGAPFRMEISAPYVFRLNKPTALSSGEWVLPVTHAVAPTDDWFAGEKQLQGVAVSNDEGKTWALHGAIKAPPWALECMVSELRNGSLWLLTRTGSGVLWESYSSDKGITWTEGKASTIANPGSRFFIRRLASGGLLLVNHFKPSGRSHLEARVSFDEGESWNGGLMLDERSGVSYPDGVQDSDGLIWIVYDRDRAGAGDICLARFREADVVAGKNVSGAVCRKQIVNRLHKRRLLPSNWDPVHAANHVLTGLVLVTDLHVKGAHDAEFVCVGNHAYIMEHDNDQEPGHSAGKAMYCVLTVVDLQSLKVEKRLLLAKAGQMFANVTLPDAMVFVPRIIQKNSNVLRCYFVSQPAYAQAQTWYRDFNLNRGEFADTIHKAKLKTAAGIFDMQPQYLYADAIVHGFTQPAANSGMYIFDSFKRFDGRTYVALNNFPGKQNALAQLHDDCETFEVMGHFNEPQVAQMSESAVNRLPDGTWMAICRSDRGNYLFSTSEDGRHWTEGRERPFICNGDNSKPTFDRFKDVYYLGWQEKTRVGHCRRSVFNIDVSKDGFHWERKYRFATPDSFQYPTFHFHNGAIWVSVTQSDHLGSTDRIMFGKLEDVRD